MKIEKTALEIKHLLSSRNIAGEIFAELWEEASIRFENGKIEFEQYSKGQGAGIRLLKSKKVAFFSTSQIDLDRIKTGLLDTADLLDNLPETALQDFSSPTPAVLKPRKMPRSIEMDIPRNVIENLSRQHATVRNRLPSIVRDVFEFTHKRSRIYFTNTNNVTCESEKDSFEQGVSLVVDSNGEKLDWDEENDASTLDTLRPMDEMIGELIPLLEKTVGGRAIDTGERCVVFHPTAGRQFCRAILECLKGNEINRKMTFLADKIGRKIASDTMTLIDDPLRTDSPRYQLFDGEGVPCARKVMIENGVLKNYFDNLTSAAESGRTPGNAHRGYREQPGTGWTEIVMAKGDTNPAEILQKSNNGLWITRLLGFGLEPVSGGYSIGASGQLIENGKPGRAVAGITIAGLLSELLMQIDLVGNDLRIHHNINCPTFRINKMMIGGL